MRIAIFYKVQNNTIGKISINLMQLATQMIFVIKTVQLDRHIFVNFLRAMNNIITINNLITTQMKLKG